MKLCPYIVIAILFFRCFAAHAAGPGEAEKNLKDGAYKGASPMMDVSVTVKNGRIEEIKFLRHTGGAGYDELVRPMANEMIKSQTTDVNAITGATVSSDALKKAVESAIRKAKNN